MARILFIVFNTEGSKKRCCLVLRRLINGIFILNSSSPHGGGRVWEVFCVYSLRRQRPFRDATTGPLSRSKFRGETSGGVTKSRLFCGFSGYCVYFSIFSHCSTSLYFTSTYGILVLALPFRPSFFCLQRNLFRPLNQTKLTKLSDYFNINLS